jgi:hypothetical protein
MKGGGAPVSKLQSASWPELGRALNQQSDRSIPLMTLVLAEALRSTIVSTRANLKVLSLKGMLQSGSP